MAVSAPDASIEFLVYGADGAVCHLRVMIDVETEEQADAVIGRNLHNWASRLEAATGLCQQRAERFEPLRRGEAAFAVVLSQAGEDGECPRVTIEDPLQRQDLAATASAMTAFTSEADIHLHFFSRFVDEGLPQDIRWLNGYRVLEWHFRRGQGDLARCPEWRALLETQRRGLEPYLRNGQTLHGLMEQIRASVAHAMVREPPPGGEVVEPDLGVETFPALESLVIEVMENLTCNGFRLGPRHPRIDP